MGRFSAKSATRSMATMAAFSLWATSAQAQDLRGRLVDGIFGGAIPEAEVIVTRGGEMVGATVSDGDGSFEVQLPGPGTFSLQASRQGYRTLTRDSLVIAAGQVLDLGEIGLDAAPIVIGEVRAAPERGRLPGRERIRQRQLLGKGVILPGALIARDDPSSLTHYLAEKADLWVRYNGRGEPYLWSPKGPYNCLVVQVNHWPLGTSGYRSLDEIRFDRVAAIEIYDNFRDVPPEPMLTWAVDRCGLVNIWTWNSW